MRGFILPVLLLLLSLFSASGSQGQNAITSTESLSRTFKLERELFGILKQRMRQIQGSLDIIYDYTRDVESLYSKEGCWPLQDSCLSPEVLDKIVGNPIYNYQVLRRLTVNWKNTEESLRKIDVKEILRDVTKLKRRYGSLPDGSDLQGAAKALNRMQKTYNINATEFSQGNILGTQTSASLGMADTLYLGRFAANTNYNDVALNWLKTAESQALSTEESANDQTLVQIKLALRQVNRKLSKQSPVSVEEEDYYKLGLVPPRTEDPKKVVTNNDERNFEALCRGQILLPPIERSKLVCYLDDRNLPSLKISPLKVEINHREPHLVLTFHDLFSDAEIEAIKDSAGSKLKTAGVGNEKKISDMRSSSHAWIPDGESEVVDRISERIERIIGLRSVARLDPEAKREEYEMLQVANYGMGGHYDIHHDSMFIYKEPDFLPKSLEETKRPYVTGDRMSTFMIYLSDVTKGGNTAFPRLGIATTPKRGSAVFWHNIKRSGRSDMLMVHGACPVVLGSKWVANKWIREVANIFKRPCIQDINF